MVMKSSCDISPLIPQNLRKKKIFPLLEQCWQDEFAKELLCLTLNFSSWISLKRQKKKYSITTNEPAVPTSVSNFILFLCSSLKLICYQQKVTLFKIFKSGTLFCKLHYEQVSWFWIYQGVRSWTITASDPNRPKWRFQQTQDDPTFVESLNSKHAWLLFFCIYQKQSELPSPVWIYSQQHLMSEMCSNFLVSKQFYRRKILGNRRTGPSVMQTQHCHILLKPIQNCVYSAAFQTFMMHMWEISFHMDVSIASNED